MPAPGLEEAVGVHALGDEDVRQQAREAPRKAPIVRVRVVRSEGQHTDPVRAVQQRGEQPRARTDLLLDHRITQERPSGG